jgi:hypothetical protein
MLITYDSSIPDALLPLVKERFAKVLPYFPKWAYEITIAYGDENADGAALSCHADYSYRFIRINVFPYWFDEIDWDVILFHEIMHALFTPYTLRIERLIAAFVADDNLRKYITQELTDGEESVAQDMAYLARSLTTYKK